MPFCDCYILKGRHTCGCRVLGQIHQGACVSDEAGPDELANHDGEVGRHGVHARLEIVVQLRPVLANGNHLKETSSQLSKRYGAEQSEFKWPLFLYSRVGPQDKRKEGMVTREMCIPARTSTRCCPYLRR
jgi:hypothetical protein